MKSLPPGTRLLPDPDYHEFRGLQNRHADHAHQAFVVDVVLRHCGFGALKASPRFPQKF